MRQGIKEETLRAMLEAGAVREVLVSRQDDKWGLRFVWAAPEVAGCRCARAVRRCAPGPV